MVFFAVSSPMFHLRAKLSADTPEWRSFVNTDDTIAALLSTSSLSLVATFTDAITFRQNI
jgi:hypothetical protein